MPFFQNDQFVLPLLIIFRSFWREHFHILRINAHFKGKCLRVLVPKQAIAISHSFKRNRSVIIIKPLKSLVISV